MLEKETQEKLSLVFQYAKLYHELLLKQFENDVDALYMIVSHKEFMNTIAKTLTMTPNTNSDEIKAMIYVYDEVISAWREGLNHYMPTESKTKNDIYSVLFAISMSVYNIIQIKEEIEEYTESV